MSYHFEKNTVKKRYNTKYMYLLHILSKLCAICTWNNSYNFDALLSVYLRIILVINQLNAQILVL